MNTATEVIPGKTKVEYGGGTPAVVSNATRSGDTESATGGGCALRKKHLPSTSNTSKTHPTKECRKWNRDGTSKPFQLGNGHGNDSELL